MDKNIVLIGFSGTGKTFVGKLVSEKLQLKFIDIDTEIKRRCAMNIGDIFEKHGESFFREIEAEIVREFSRLKDYVISTGGGVVLNSTNIDLLKENGIIFRFKGSVETIIDNLKKDSVHMKDRPLLKTENLYQRIDQLINEREQYYCRCYDYEVGIDKLSLMEVAETVICLLNQERLTSQVSFFDFCMQYPDKELFTYIAPNTSPASLTGRELATKIQFLGSVFQEKLAAQEKVLLLFAQGLEYIYALLSCWYANIIAIPLAVTNLAAPEKLAEKVNTILSDSQAKGIITHTGFMEFLKTEPVLSTLPIWNVDELAQTVSPIKPARLFAQDDLGLILYTSGSTSKPKGVMLSHQNLMSRALRGGNLWEIDRESRIVSWMPQFHSFGLDFSILTPLVKGASCIIFTPDGFLKNPEDWWRIIHHYQATHTGAPNFAFDYCCSTIDMTTIEDLSLHSLKAIISGGEPVRRETYQNFWKKFMSLGLNEHVFCPEYGLSEAGSVVTKKPGQPLHFLTLDLPSLEKGIVKHSQRKNKCKTITNCGEISPDVEIWIVDPQTSELCKAEAVGEIWLRCSSTAKGYFSLELETSQSLWGNLKNSSEEGFLRTGDLGFIEENCLYIVGRQKEVIIINGKNHHPVDIEWTIHKQFPELTLPVVVFACEIADQEKVVVVNELETPLDQTEYVRLTQRMISAVSENHELEIYEIVLVEKGGIPKTGSGKTQRKNCRGMYSNQELPALYRYRREASALPSHIDIPGKSLKGNIQDFIVVALSQKMGLIAEKICLTKNIRDYGTNSIILMRLARDLEKQFAIKLTGREMLEHLTVESLAAYLKQKIEISGAQGGIQDLNSETGSNKMDDNNDNREAKLLEKFKSGELTLEEIQDLV